MVSLHGVSSALIARNESWVRQQAAALMRRLPSNVQKADLIQVGLIAVAQAAVTFAWEGDPESDEARAAFVRYAQFRVKGAMLDELRQMDQLGRADRRKIKAVQIARDRWRMRNGTEPGLGDLAAVCELPVDEVARLDQAAAMVQAQSLDEQAEQDSASAGEPATPQDEVEARVDTALVLRHLEGFFAGLPEHERRVIDSYLGIGLTPAELADSMQLSVSRVRQIFHEVVDRIGRHLRSGQRRALDQHGAPRAAPLDALVAEREAELARHQPSDAWGELIERSLTAPSERFGGAVPQRLRVTADTRWG
ncbi:MAG TPA: sigma-70 family RNA polymerase sigma factor [Burkholderiaceae bacterium]|nr:sigma-70 family RNA polymerase sigma factor [Burkholderiaceae bacterium]